MSIKYYFDELKKIGKKKYYSKNGEEELYFISNNLQIEIFNIDGKIDLIINNNGTRNNYLNSQYMSENSRKEISALLKDCISLEIKCKIMSKILLK